MGGKNKKKAKGGGKKKAKAEGDDEPKEINPNFLILAQPALFHSELLYELDVTMEQKRQNEGIGNIYK